MATKKRSTKSILEDHKVIVMGADPTAKKAVGRFKERLANALDADDEARVEKRARAKAELKRIGRPPSGVLAAGPGKPTKATVSKTFAEDVHQRAIEFGRVAARKVFRKRGNHTEAHLGEEELGAMLAVAFETGSVDALKKYLASMP